MTDDQLISCEIHRMRQRLYLAGIPREDAAQAARLALLRADTPHRTTVIRRAIIDEIDRWTGCWRKGRGGKKQGFPLEDAPEPVFWPTLDEQLDAARRWARAYTLTATLEPRTGRILRRYLRGQSHAQIASATGLSEQMVWHYRRRGLKAMRRAVFHVESPIPAILPNRKHAIIRQVAAARL